MVNLKFSTKNYLFFFDDSKIKEGDYVVDITTKTFFDFFEDYSKTKNIKKIVGHLPLNNSPVLKKIYLLPDLNLNLMPVSFKCEEETPFQLKTTEDSNGKKILVGKYSF